MSPRCGRTRSRASPARTRSRTTGWPSTSCPSTSPHAPPRPAREVLEPRRGQAPRPVHPVRPGRRPRGVGRLRHHRNRPRPPGVDFATGIGGVWTLLDAWDTLREKGPRRVLPMTVPMLMPNGPAAAVSLDLGARAGAHTLVSACASGTEAVARGLDLIRSRPRRRRRRAAAPKPPSTRCRSPPSPPCRRSPRATTIPSTPRAPTTVTATASSSARAPAPSCSRPRSTRSPAAPGSTPNWPARSVTATRTTSPPRTPRASAPPAR